jgi:hypothetical protein
MIETFKRGSIEIDMYLNADRSVDGKRLMRVRFLENGELVEFDCYPDKSKNDTHFKIEDQFSYVNASLNFDRAYSSRYLELIQDFLKNRPNISPSALSKEAGFDERYLRLILDGKRNPTVNFVEKLRPVLLKYGFGR